MQRSFSNNRNDAPKAHVMRKRMSTMQKMRGTVVLRTEQGEIPVGAARGVSASLDAGAAYGRINNTLDNALDDTEGAAAQPDIRATTSYGDITARSI